MIHAIEECTHCGASVRGTTLNGDGVAIELGCIGPIYGYDKRDLVVANPDGTVRLRESLFDNGLDAYAVHLCPGVVRSQAEGRRCRA